MLQIEYSENATKQLKLIKSIDYGVFERRWKFEY